MKFTKEMQERIITFVEVNGLYPQPCGATLQTLCKACGIDWKTFKKWEQKADFSERLSRAREHFASTVEIGIVNALVKSAQGVDFTRIKEKAKAERIVIEHKDGSKETRLGELKKIEAFRETQYFPPNVEAAKFVLTNMAPERWKLKQDVTVQGGAQPIALELTPAAIDGLTTAIENGATPRDPAEEGE